MSAARALLSAAVILGGVLAAQAQTYPSRLVKLVVPTSAGGPTDGMARRLAEKLAPVLGQTVIVENLAGGAGGTLGARAVASAPPDGHTLLFSIPGPLVTAPVVYKNIGYDPLKSFAPVATILSSPQLLVVNPSLPVKSLPELVAYAKANPGRISFASGGFGTQPHLLGEMLKLLAGLDMVHVPYKGAAPALTDLMTGHVQMYFETVASMYPHVEAGKLRALAVADDTRNSHLPETPTTAEAGYPKLKATLWMGVLAPAGTPAAIVNRLNAAINDALRTPDFETAFARVSAKAKIGSPQDFADFLGAETRKWAEVVNAAGIKVE